MSVKSSGTFKSEHGYTQQDWDIVSDNPPLTKQEIKAARPFREVFPEIAKEMEKAVRGRPKADLTKISVTIRLDPEVIDQYKATGKGWQSRMNDDLHQKVFIHPMRFDGSGSLVDEPLVITHAASLHEAAVDYFGKNISFEGAIHQLRGSIALVGPGAKVEKKMVYRKD